MTEPIWTENALADLRREFGDAYGGRTVLVTATDKPYDRNIVTNEARLRAGATDVMALRVGHEKLIRETGWMPLVSWEEGVLRTIQWYAQNRDRWIGRVDWLSSPAPIKL